MLNRLLCQLFCGMICIYQRWISPLRAPCCRFAPSCSSYALEAFSRHPLHKAVYLSIKRLLRCHPWGGSGYDPVP